MIYSLLDASNEAFLEPKTLFENHVRFTNDDIQMGSKDFHYQNGVFSVKYRNLYELLLEEVDLRIESIQNQEFVQEEYLQSLILKRSLIISFIEMRNLNSIFN